MPKIPDKQDPSQADFEAAGADVLSDFVRDAMHAKVQALRDELPGTIDTSGRDDCTDSKVMRGYLRNSRSFRMKAEELNTVADHTQSPQARQTFRDLACSYDRLADRAEARETADRDKEPAETG